MPANNAGASPSHTLSSRWIFIALCSDRRNKTADERNEPFSRFAKSNS